ncbi:glycosyltransferase family 2 protein [Flavobacterium amniphilum]|uniref:glycosyltransferase family 2 protein n=1 Tax=Flavobacterium amniphilum TaxID=1834035 RepID=UPI00202A7A9A|nr:glycosyltransferase family A protein [Flavobacterium amniphilum]MCL9805619.1 glycosyltransferase family 2 protein [Flavobacterium amniphilum]
MTTFSIVIPLYNKENHIGETLKSALSQTFNDFEIVIVNDGSTDNSIEKVKAFDDPRIKLFTQQNSGAAAARNLGIQQANSKLIAFLDADDIWFENHLEELSRLQKNFPGCGMYCSRYYIRTSKNSTFKMSYINSITENFRGIIPDYFDASLINRVGLTSAIAIPKEILKDDLLFNPEVSSGQDLELFTKIALQFPTAITDKYTFEYNFAVENQLSKTPITKKKLLDLDQFCEAEKTNPSLKKFLDNYRKEYALHYKIAGDYKRSKELYQKANPENISQKFKILYALPRMVLISLLSIKRFLLKKGFDFRVYN